MVSDGPFQQIHCWLNSCMASLQRQSSVNRIDSLNTCFVMVALTSMHSSSGMHVTYSIGVAGKKDCRLSCESIDLQSTGDIQQHACHQKLPGVLVQILLNQAIGAGRRVPQGLPGVNPRLQKGPSLGGLLG